MSQPAELAPHYEAVRRFHQEHGPDSYSAAKLLPRETRSSVCALYAFLCVPVEIAGSARADDPAAMEQVRDQLESWREKWHDAYHFGHSGDPVLAVTAHAFREHEIPYEYSQEYAEAMIRHTETAQYATYAELENHMLGTGAKIALMMSHVIGWGDAHALQYATSLGCAAQLTGLLRNVDEDYHQRGRVYLPQDELEEFRLSNDDIAARHFPRKFHDLMEFQCQRAHRLYDEAEPGIALLRREGQLAVRAAATLPRAILHKLEKRKYNIFKGRAQISARERILLLLGARQAQRASGDGTDYDHASGE